MKWYRRVRNGIVLLLGVWVLGDFIYGQIVRYRLAKWEATIERDPRGVQEGREAYTIGDGARAILMVHGINDSPYVYRHMAPVLADSGFTCRVMRLPGFAMPIEAFAAATHQDWVAAVGREIEALRQQHAQVFVVAHSLGGAVTIAHLLEHPHAVDGAVLLAPALAVSNHRSPLLSARAWHEIGRWCLLFTNITQSPFPADIRDPQQRDDPGRMDFTPRTIFDETFHLLDHNRNRAAQFKPPLMMALSKHDQVVDWRAAEQFYQQAGATTKQIHFMENAGHVIPIDYEWQQLTQQIAEFASR